MITVGVDRAAVESALGAGELSCPTAPCGGRLAPWGWARARSVRGELGQIRLTPRRARCTVCRHTHVLLPACCLVRRADEVGVIGAALVAKAGGAGHRRIAVALDRPPSTVRGWLRRVAAVAQPVLAVLAALAAELGVEFLPPAPTLGPLAAVVELVGATARAAARRLGGSCAPWRLAAAVCTGALLAPRGPHLPRWLVEPANTSWLLAGAR